MAVSRRGSVRGRPAGRPDGMTRDLPSASGRPGPREKPTTGHDRGRYGCTMGLRARGRRHIARFLVDRGSVRKAAPLF